MWQKSVTLAMTGASGAQYGLRLLEVLIAQNCRVFLLISKAARVVLATETDVKLPAQAAALQNHLTEHLKAAPGQLLAFGQEDWMSPVASGSGAPSSMVICPCSTGTLSSIAMGACDNLIERAADVCLKERRQLILVPRETPFSEIHLKNMLTLTQMGAVILPACPGFYHRPSSVEDLVDFIVARILAQLGLEQNLLKKWGEDRL